jgi:hypothetical protein
VSIGREESLFLTVSEDHRKRAYPEYVQRMSAPFSRAGGMVAAYEGVLLGGADKRFGLDELNLWLRRYRYAAYDMDVLLPAAHLCLERAVRADLMAERPGVLRWRGRRRERSCAVICYNTAAARAAGSIFTTLQRGFPARKRSRIAGC